jgi:hypothetical protein
MRPACRLPVAALLLLAACESPSGPYGGTTPARVDAVSGDLQPNAVVGNEASVPIVARVVNVEGNPLRGKTVTFQVVSGDGTVTATTAQTDEKGEASARWKLGIMAGDTQRVEARVETRTGQSPVVAVFRAVGKPDAPSALAPVYAATLGGAVSSPLDDSIRVVVRDRHGNLVPGASVNWSAVTGGGSFDPATSVTDAAGVAWTRWTLGAAPGEQRARATLQGTGTSVEVAANAGTELRILSGDNLLAFDGSLWEQPVVALYGPNGPIGDARVEWTVTSGGGSVSVPVSRTSQANPASGAPTAWTLGGAAGTHQLTARVGNLRATLTAHRPAAWSPTRAGTPGGRVLDVGEEGALVLDSAGGTYTLRLRPVSGGETGVVATGDARLDGRVIDGGVLYLEPSPGGAFKLYEWRSFFGARLPLGETTRDLLRDRDWAAWGTGTKVFRRNLRDRVTDSIADSDLAGLVDLSNTGQLLFTRAAGGARYVAWGRAGTTVQVASGNARVRVAGDTAVYALDPSSLSQFTFYTQVLPSGEARAFFRGRDGQRPRFSAMGRHVALREEGSYGLELSRLSVLGDVRRMGRRPSSPSVYGPEDQALTAFGGAAFLVREGGTTWLVYLSHASDVVQATQVPADARLLERSGFVYLVSGGTVYVLG